jgi:hypothetical protein
LGLFRLFGLFRLSGQEKGYLGWQKDNLIPKPIKYGQNPYVFRERISNPRLNWTAVIPNAKAAFDTILKKI